MKQIAFTTLIALSMATHCFANPERDKTRADLIAAKQEIAVLKKELEKSKNEKKKLQAENAKLIDLLQNFPVSSHPKAKP